MSSEDSVMSFYGDDMDIMSPTTDVLSTLSSLSSMSSSITDATIAAGDLVSLSQAFSSKKSGSMPPTSAPRSTATSSRATSNPPSHAKSSTYSAVSASPSSPISTSTKKKTISNPAPKTRAAPTKASKPLPDFLGGGRRIKDRDGNFVEVQMNLFSQCDEDTPPMVWKGTPLTIPSTVPRYTECNGDEIETCATLRMMPAQVFGD
ncbi:hypothetical protein BC829DRAFT_214308 [Chytridium lagenaria]|nr:hypothetical protein BC829DRAFT_214308 [Chytridium lagenaria]